MNRHLLLGLALGISLTCCGGTTSGGAAVADGGAAADGSGGADTGPSPTGQTADGAGTCLATVDAYCAGATPCPTTPSMWCADGGVTSLQPANAAGTCSNGETFVRNMRGGDQPADYFYDPAGKLVAIAGWESNAPCNGACRYVCIAGPAEFDPSKVATLCSTTTWVRGENDGGSVPTSSCRH